MTCTELWLTYHIASRANKQVTAQLVELEFQNHKLTDLEDVLDHVFKQGFVESKLRPLTWCETKDGKKIKSSSTVEELIKEGAGKTPETALKVVIADMVPHFWFTYFYLHGAKESHVSQRIKLDNLPKRPEFLAHISNHIFSQGYLPTKFRSVIRWETACGKPLREDTTVQHILSSGFAENEAKAVRLVIDDAPYLHDHCHDHHDHHDHHHHCDHHHEHDHHHDSPCGCPKKF